MSVQLTKTKTFSSLAQRILFGFNFIFSDFAPIKSELADEDSQRKLHTMMGQMLERLYDDPSLINIPICADKAYDWYALNNSDKELDAVYKDIFKIIYEFYKYLYIAFLYGEIENDHLTIVNRTMSINKASYKSVYQSFLQEFGIQVNKGRTETVITADRDILQAWKLLAEAVPVDVNPWTPYALYSFVSCSFTNDYEYLIGRIDNAVDLNGLFIELAKNCTDKGYVKKFQCGFGSSCFDFNIRFEDKVGGFVVGYNPRKYWQFFFGCTNSIGVKAMLENFETLKPEVQKYLIDICKPCQGCLSCTKGGKNKIFAAKVQYEGNEYVLCNDNYSLHDWETINRELVSVLFMYHEAQAIYGSR